MLVSLLGVEGLIRINFFQTLNSSFIYSHVCIFLSHAGAICVIWCAVWKLHACQACVMLQFKRALPALQ